MHAGKCITMKTKQQFLTLCMLYFPVQQRTVKKYIMTHYEKTSRKHEKNM